MEILETSKVVTEIVGQVSRYIRAIPVGDACLTCHRPVERVDAGLKDALARTHPRGRAVGH